VAHGCNPSYSGVRDQEDHNSKPGCSSPDPILKITHHKKELVEFLKIKALNSFPRTKKKKFQWKVNGSRIFKTI
jgi:hypothetical protein